MTQKLIKSEVEKIHRAIGVYYHPVSYTHYGVDPDQKSFHKVVWKLESPLLFQGDHSVHRKTYTATELASFTILKDEGEKKITLMDETTPRMRLRVEGSLLDPRDPGDQTVPAHSAYHQKLCNDPRFRGVFELKGYDHQNSYNDDKVQASTLYSIVQILLKELKS